MKKSRSGFTLIELLVVMVVIAILATIIVSAYNGTQARTRDTKRLTDAENIIKALRLYESDNPGTYPATTATPVGTCTSLIAGYNYSFGTAGTWLNSLVTQQSIDSVPTPPVPSCTSYYAYISPATTAYGCGSRTSPYYVLVVTSEGTITPKDSKSFTPCAGAAGIPANWTASKTNWVFASDNLQS